MVGVTTVKKKATVCLFFPFFFSFCLLCSILVVWFYIHALERFTFPNRVHLALAWVPAASMQQHVMINHFLLERAWGLGTTWRPGGGDPLPIE